MRAGLALSGLFSGFVSSTVSIAAMGARARAEPAQQQLGDAGLLLGTALAAIADAHSPVAALATLNSSGRVDSETQRPGTLVAVSANACTRSVTAFAAGGAVFGLRVTYSLLASCASAIVVAWAQG